MAEPFFLAAWTAGMIEGASILSHEKSKSQKAEDDETFGLTNFVLPSIVYGAAALPMSLIGESPGPALVSLIPNFPSSTKTSSVQGILHHAHASSAAAEPLRRVDSESSSMGMVHTLPPSRFSSTGNHRDDYAAQEGLEPNDDPTRSTTTTANNKRHVPMLHRVRMENRMTLEAAQNQKKQQLRPQATAMASTSVSPSDALYRTRRATTPYRLVATTLTTTTTPTSFTRYFATLDGPAVSLVTPLAESMRRFRILLVGAGVVSLYWQTQLRDQQKQEQLRATNGHRAGSGSGQVHKNSTLLNLAQATNRSQVGGGVVLRLVDSQQSSTRISGRFPVPRSLGALAGTPEEADLPLSKDWLIRRKSFSNDEKSELYLLVEANVSTSFEKCFGHNNSSRSHRSTLNIEDRELQKAMVASKRIAMMARQKNLLTDDKGDGDGATLVNVFVGTGPATSTPWISEHNDPTIYLDGLSALGAELSSLLVTSSSSSPKGGEDRQQPQGRDKGLEPISSDTPSVQRIVNSNGKSDVFESLGQTIRRVLRLSTGAFGHTVADYRDKPTLRVISDNPQFVAWLKRSVLVDWEIIWLEPGNLVRSESNVPSCVTLVCCQNEEKTFNVALSMVTSSSLSTAKESGASADIVALLETSRMEQLLTQAGRISDSIPTLHVQSAESIYGNLFDNVQRLLSSGTSPEQIRGLARSDPTCTTVLGQV
jgi:hypothetical protein